MSNPTQKEIKNSNPIDISSKQLNSNLKRVLKIGIPSPTQTPSNTPNDDYMEKMKSMKK